MDLDLYDDTYLRFLSDLKKDARLLELGCGPGNITRQLLKNRPDLKILATDFSPRMIELAKSNVPTVDFRQADAKQISTISEQFDAIVCGFITPYLDRSEVGKLLSDCAKLLISGGKLYLSTLEGDHEKSGWQSSSDGKSSTIVYLYSISDIKEMLFQNGFSYLSILRKCLNNDSHLIFISDFS